MSGRSKRLMATHLSIWVLSVWVLVLPSLADANVGLANDETTSEADSDSTVEGTSTDESESQDHDEAPAESSRRASFFDKLQIHGFLTQAFADASFVEGGVLGSPSSLESALGIPEGGTSDYRTLALQFRYDMSPKDVMIVQFSSRTLGFSPINDVEDEIELDWAFYERQLSETTSIKIGRVQIPIGIYNEIRDVGTLLPFYRPPFGWYSEGSFTSETIDGLVLSNSFFQEASWSLDADFYIGEWKEFEIDPNNPEVAVPVRAKDAGGVQLWLNTPITGLRFGAGFNTKRLQGGLEFLRPPGTSSPASDHIFFSVDGTFERFAIRSEYRELDSTLATPIVDIGVTTIGWYLQLGYFFSDKVQLWAQLDDIDLEADSVIHLRKDTSDFRTDVGIALNYFFKPNLVLKAEYHEVEEEQPLPPNIVFVPPGGFAINPFPPVKADNGSYSILSFSVSF